MYKSKKPYLYGTGRRKSSVARVHLFPNGTGAITINGRDIDDYFGLETLKLLVRQPLATTDTLGKVDIVATVTGGGVTGQAGAIRHGVARALLQVNPEFRLSLIHISQGKKVEILVGYEPSFRFFGEWWKQLFGETEGKDGKALFPASVEFTADLHSMGQYIQQGERLMLETVVRFARSRGSVTIPHDPDNVDGLNFLAGKDLSFVAEQAMRGTLLAHVDGGVPNLVVTAPARDAQSVGWLIYFFEYACGLSGYLLEINPFDQPGVEADVYKRQPPPDRSGRSSRTPPPPRGGSACGPAGSSGGISCRSPP